MDETVREIPDDAPVFDPSPIGRLASMGVSEEYVKMIGNEKWLFPNLIIQTQVVVIIAKSGGGKTTVSFEYLAPYMIKKHGCEVFYFDCDSPASDHRRMFRRAREIGEKFHWINPLTNGNGADALLDVLREMAKSRERLDGSVFFFDTLKKFVSVLDKKSVKPFFEMVRNLLSLGATVVLLGHANKHRDASGHLVFEGVGDVLSDADALLFFERITAQDGVYITTVVDPDKGAKVRGLYEPITFHIDGERNVTLCDKVVSVPDWTASGPKERTPTETEVEDKIRDFLADRDKPAKQTAIVNALKGTPGLSIHRIRNVLNAVAVLEEDAEPGMITYKAGDWKNVKLYSICE